MPCRFVVQMTLKAQKVKFTTSELQDIINEANLEMSPDQLGKFLKKQQREFNLNHHAHQYLKRDPYALMALYDHKGIKREKFSRGKLNFEISMRPRDVWLPSSATCQEVKQELESILKNPSLADTAWEALESNFWKKTVTLPNTDLPLEIVLIDVAKVKVEQKKKSSRSKSSSPKGRKRSSSRKK